MELAEILKEKDPSNKVIEMMKGITASNCCRCNRALRSKKSQDAGYGPVCFKKEQEEEKDKRENMPR